MNKKRNKKINKCRFCGCTDNCACPGGCYWVDSEKTICSECVGKVLTENAELRRQFEELKKESLDYAKSMLADNAKLEKLIAELKENALVLPLVGRKR